jgi:RNA polymerase sigma-70 factor, ECF subfamily
MIENNLDLNKSDEELVLSVLENKEHYRVLVKRYEAKLARYIMRLAKISQDEARDVLQEVFIKAYVNLNDFDSSLKFSSWIYRIAHNEAVNFLRRNKNKAINIDANDSKLENIFPAIRGDLDVEGEIDEKFFEENIRRIIDNLKNKDFQSVLILKYIEDKNYQEISDILKKPVGTVSTLLNRAKKQLKNEILKETRLRPSTIFGTTARQVKLWAKQAKAYLKK